ARRSEDDQSRAAENPGSGAAQEKRRRRLFGDRESRDEVGRVTLQEVEDLVPSRIEAGREGGPGDGRLRGNGRKEGRVSAASLERGQTGQASGGEHLLDHRRIHSVEAQDDDPGLLGGGGRQRGRKERSEGQDPSHGSDQFTVAPRASRIAGWRQ